MRILAIIFPILYPCLKTQQPILPYSGIVSDLPEDRQFPVVASIDDKLFLCGGTNNSGIAKDTCFYYSFVQRKWIEMEEPMPHGPLSRSAGVAAYGDFYILGGQTSSGEATDKVRNKVFSLFTEE